MAEEPFTVVWQSCDGKNERLTSTMRTPGKDLELAMGLLFTEGLLQSRQELETLQFCVGGGINELNRIKAKLRITAELAATRLKHRPSASLPQSACGMCAADDLSSPEALLAWASSRYRAKSTPPNPVQLQAALEHLDTSCPLFRKTGASHACVIVGQESELLACGEDVGRHNACDKALGCLILEEQPVSKSFQLDAHAGVLFSSRLSFELASKVVAAGISWMASVGAPTHLAVELAQRCKIPLYGFLSQDRHNLYTKTGI